jgi:hypothetical protein
MEDQREQQQSQPVAPPAGAYPPAPPAGQYVAPAAFGPPVPSGLEIVSRVLYLLSRRVLYGLYGLWKLVQPRLGWVLLTSFLLGIIGFLGLLLALLRLVSDAPTDDSRTALIPPAPAVVSFLRGQQTYDADLMWESFSPEFQAALEEREITREALAQQAESERQAGQRYGDPEYIGGVAADGSRQMFFFTVEIASPQPERSGTFSMVFTVDGDGKIVSVRM